MQAYLDAALSAKKALPRQALFAFNVCADAVIKAEISEILSLGFVQADHSLREDVIAGKDREVRLNAKEAQSLKSLFPKARLQIGGQAGRAAQLASSLGVDSYLICTSQSKELFSLFKNKGKVYAWIGKRFSKASSLPSSKSDFPVHYVFEYETALGKKTRLIASYDPNPLIPKSCSANCKPFQKLFLGGMHLSSQKEIEETASLVKKWKKQNPPLKIFLELGNFQGKGSLLATKKFLIPPVDCVGLNELELFALTGASGLESIKRLPKHIWKILYHSPEVSFSLPKDPGDSEAILFAKLVCSYIAKYGKEPDFPSLERYAKESETLHVYSPAQTVGLGDAFSCAYFLAAN